MRLLIALTIGSVLSAPAVGLADAPALEIGTRAALREACDRARGPGERELYVVTVDPDGWALDGWEDGYLHVATRRNLRAFRGGVELFTTGMEPIAFAVTSDGARRLRARRAGAALRLGFFLGFDNPHRTACLVRPSAITSVRIDLAFVEWVAPDGSVVAREDADRLLAWLDDREREPIAGTGPRGELDVASLSAGAGVVPATWQRALAASGPRLSAEIGRCHASGLARGAEARGRVVVRVDVDADGGGVRSAEVELSSIGDDAEATCVAEVLARHLRFPRAPERGPGGVQLSVPVRLTD